MVILRREALSESIDGVVSSTCEKSREMERERSGGLTPETLVGSRDSDQAFMLRQVSSTTRSSDIADWAALGLYAHERIIDSHDEDSVDVFQLGAVDVAG